METDRQALIKDRAYEIWEREGRPEGREAEHWQQAELEITNEAGASSGNAPQDDGPGLLSRESEESAGTEPKSVSPAKAKRPRGAPSRARG